jgi:uncharacterized OB-fold protein
MSHGHEVKCPHCGKNVSEKEMFCWNCDEDISDLKIELEKPGKESHNH